MRFCANCGKEILENSKFCVFCGAPVMTEASPASEQPPFEPQQTPVTPAFAQNIDEDYLIREEQEFLDITHRILRWERTAWSICGKVLTILGIVFTSIFGFLTLIGVIELIDGNEFVVGLLGIGFLYTVIFGGMFLTIGIIQRKVANKMPIYLDSLYEDFSITNARSGNIGMLIFSIFFGEVALVFFIINFVRLKSKGAIIKRILTRQGKI